MNSVRLGYTSIAVGSVTLPELDSKVLSFVTVELLKNETLIVDLASPTLPALKLLLDVPREFKDQSDGYTKLVHGILSACLVNIDHMGWVLRVLRAHSSHFSSSGRQGPASTRKVQSNLLASVLVLTIVPPTVKVSQVAIDHCCFLICQKLIVDEVNPLGVSFHEF